MRFLILGCGSIGTRHIKNLKQISKNCEIDVYDSNRNLLDKVSNQLNVNSLDKTDFTSIHYDCVFICTPPVFHINLASQAIQSGLNVFIEKPLSSNSKGISTLLSLSRKNNVLVFVGYNLRFHKAISIIKKIIDSKKYGKPIHSSAFFGSFLIDWRPEQDYRKSYTAVNVLGGGIIHDASHELDYMKFLFGVPIYVQSHYIKTNMLKTDTEALADIILEFKNNLLATIHLDYLRRDYNRSLEVMFESGTISWSFQENKIIIYDAKTQMKKKIVINESVNTMYVNELKHIIKCLKEKKQSKIINLKNGISTFEISEIIKKSQKTGRKIKLRWN